MQIQFSKNEALTHIGGLTTLEPYCITWFTESLNS